MKYKERGWSDPNVALSQQGLTGASKKWFVVFMCVLNKIHGGVSGLFEATRFHCWGVLGGVEEGGGAPSAISAFYAVNHARFCHPENT